MTGTDVFVHPQALCESDRVGAGTRIWAFAHVMSGAAVGERCNIGGHCFVEEGAVIGDGVTVKNGVSVWRGVTLEDDVFVGPNAVFTNDLRPRAAVKRAPEELLTTLVRRGATLGANATIVCDVVVGVHAFVGAGAVVVSDVADHALVVGSPARRIGWACSCGLRLPASLECGCGLAYEDIGGALRAR
jgi:UDP-2-acetamido-3-amino-2,3-dideoxy-glucuronate N-acetyltransferase